MEPAWLKSGEQLVGGPGEQQSQTHVCTKCSQRVFSGHGVGTFVFPNDGKPLVGPDTLVFRVQFRDCMFGIPATSTLLPGLPKYVRVYASQGADLSAAGWRLDVGVAVLSGVAVDDSYLGTAIGTAANLFAKAGVDLHMVGVVELSGVGEGPVSFGDGEHGVLDQLHVEALQELSRVAHSPFVPIIIVPCLQESDPVTGASDSIAGVSPRIPGLGHDYPYASAVFVAASAGCGSVPLGGTEEESAAAERLGLIIAHELGHYLGLYHSDAESSSHRPPGGHSNVMNSNVISLDPEQASWSDSQCDVLGRHPEVMANLQRPGGTWR